MLETVLTLLTTVKKKPGMQNVGFGIIIALGLTAGFGFWYTTIHGVLPFLALGIGIDNMFVILRCLENIPEEERERNSLVENIALTMQGLNSLQSRKQSQK